MRVFTVVSMGIVAAMLAACGGGGGGSGNVVVGDVFDGTYGWAQHIGEAGPPLVGTGAWGTLLVSGAGTIDGGMSWSIENGVLDGPIPITSLPYTLAPGGRLEFLLGAVPILGGGLSADGQLGAMSTQAMGTNPSMLLMMRKGAGLGVGDMVGLYHYAQFYTAPSGTGDGVIWGAADFDGAGGVDFLAWTNVDGTVMGPAVVSETYTVDPDGTLRFSLTGVHHLGTLRPDGRVAFFSGGTGAGDVATVGLMIKFSTAASASTFAGPYHFVVQHADHGLAPVVNWMCLNGGLTSDGATAFALTGGTVLDDTGTAMTLVGPFPPVPYTVAASGAMTLPGGTAVGAVAPDGSVAALVGGTTAGDDLNLWVMIR